MIVASAAPSGAVLLRGIGFALAAYASFSTADAIVKLTSGRFSTFQIGLMLSLFALLPVLALTRGQGGLRALMPQQPRLIAARAVLTTICSFLVWNAFSMLPLAEAYAILFASPMIVTALSALVLKESVGWRRWSATIVGFAGVMVMLDPRFENLGAGHLYAAGATVCGSLSFLLLRKMGPGERSAAIVGGLFLAIILASAPLAVAHWVAPTWHEVSLLALAGLLAGSGQAGLVFATRETPAALVAPFQYTQMIWAVIFGIALFGDLPTVHLFLGLAVVIASGLFIVWRETVRAAPVTLAAGRGEVVARAARRARRPASGARPIEP